MNLKPGKLLSIKYNIILVSITILVLIFFILFCSFPIAEKHGTEASNQLMKYGLFVIFFIDCIVVFFSNLWIKNMNYEIKRSSIVINKGIFSKTEQNIPNSKVTDFVLHRSLIDRFIGIASIKIQTAGASNSGGYEGVLEGIENYKEIHQKLRNKLTSQEASIENNIQNHEQSSRNILNLILNELRDINSKLEKDK